MVRMESARILIKRLLQTKGKVAFLDRIKKNGKLLDVGCGNNSPYRIKCQRPDLYYIGLDIENYNQNTSPNRVADSYVLTSSENFPHEIWKLKDQLDAVISAHNLEHCDKPVDVLRAMVSSLKEGGRLYLSFPCEQSVFFPPRRGTLNFYDDLTHKQMPNLEEVRSLIEAEGLQIDFLAGHYRPHILKAGGMLLEPFAQFFNRTIPGFTWSFYGFESIIWASRPSLRLDPHLSRDVLKTPE
jgi:SAM-dependent methyltransferase